MTSSKRGADSVSPLKMSVYETDLRRRLAAFPRDAHAWFSLGKHLGSRGQHREAERAIRKAISLNPQPKQFWEELEKVLSLLKKTGIVDEIDRRIDRLKQIEESVEGVEANPVSSDVSPCVSCEHYTYYGCSKGQSCDALLRWRATLLRASE
ncbi:MAG: tetratricopeptide repeat protein [Candidatus Thorarchaeota archaeon]|jgi:tetratricopeptide (TPR) repeat protein